MLSRDNFTRDHIYEIKESSGADPATIERALYAFGLLEAICIIRITRVYVTDFRRVSVEHAALEGEGDLSLDYWRREHRRFFTKDLEGTGQPFSENMKVVCEEFEKVYP